MKTKLLFISSMLLFFITACSVDEQSNEDIEINNKLKVVSLVDTFSKVIMPSPEFSIFIERFQEKSASGSTTEDQEQFEQDFLSQQSPEFVELYYYVANLNLSEEELREIIIEYLAANKSFIGQVKNGTDGCSLGDSAGGEDSPLISLILSILCQESSN